MKKKILWSLAGFLLVCLPVLALVRGNMISLVSAAPSLHSTASQTSTADPIVNDGAWGGYYTIGSNYTAVNVSFTVPTLTLMKGNTTAVYTWAGLQGAKHLVQAGIHSAIDPNGHQTDFAWWFITSSAVSSFSNMTLGLAVHPGDKISVYVGSDADHDGYDKFLVGNWTRGTYQTHYEHDPNNFAGDNASAACLVERDGSSVANFGTLHMSDCGIHMDGHKGMAPIGSVLGSGENIVGGKTTLVSTSPLSNGKDFDLIWKNSGIGLPG